LTVESWGRAFRYDCTVENPQHRSAVSLATGDPRGTVLHGMGRSYGDVALNDGGRVVCTRHLDRFIRADWDTGVIRAEAGMSLGELLEVAVPQGWFLPVTPGSKFVSLGGAVANDVHGKNHHNVGSFGAFVAAVGLRRSDSGFQTLSATENPALFALTIGGLGMTGMIEWVEFRLSRIVSPMVQVENIPFDNLDDFFALSADSHKWPYAVAWIDCFAKGTLLGRGIYTRGRHAERPRKLVPHSAEPKLRWPGETPGFILNKHTIKAFNALYRRRPGARFCGDQHYDSFFYPLDGIAGWNKLYGPHGFFQHQSIIPPDAARDGVAAQLRAIEQAGQGSFLVVLKSYGPERSPGRMSFGREGVSLALDFANRGTSTQRLLRRLDDIALAHGGRMYPAKDGHMLPASFQASYPEWQALETARDPALMSSFWRRVTQTGV
jgi:L-gulonolactone oxidase